jgi:hypothetical protein
VYFGAPYAFNKFTYLSKIDIVHCLLHILLRGLPFPFLYVGRWTRRLAGVLESFMCLKPQGRGRLKR